METEFFLTWQEALLFLDRIKDQADFWRWDGSGTLTVHRRTPGHIPPPKDIE